MGYTKVYSRQFLEVNGKYIPMALSGASNATMTLCSRKEILERSWGTFVYCDDMILASPEVIMGTVKGVVDKDMDEFMFQGKWLSGAQVIRFFENGIKKAFSIEKIHERRAYSNLHGYLSCWTESLSVECRSEKYMKTSDEIENWVQEAKREKEWLLKKGKFQSIYICMSFDSIYPLRFCADMIEGEVIAKIGKRYVQYYSDNMVSYTQDRSKAMVFYDVDTAISLLPAWINEKGGSLHFCKAVEPVKKSRDYAISVSVSGSPGCFIQSLTRRHLFFSHQQGRAKRFSSEKAANKWLEQYGIIKRFRNVSNPKVVCLSSAAT